MLASVVLMLGLVLAVYKSSETTVARLNKAYDELSRYILTRPKEDTPERVRVDVGWLTQAEQERIDLEIALTEEVSATDSVKAKKP